MDKFEMTEKEWLLANGIRGMTEGEFHIDYLARAEERKAQIAKVKSFYEPIGLEPLRKEEIKELWRKYCGYEDMGTKSREEVDHEYKIISWFLPQLVKETIRKNQKGQLFRLKER